MLLANKPELRPCTIESFVGCVMTAAELGLSLTPQLGQAYITPFKDKKRGIVVATFIPGYQGLSWGLWGDIAGAVGLTFVYIAVAASVFSRVERHVLEVGNLSDY